MPMFGDFNGNEEPIEACNGGAHPAASALMNPPTTGRAAFTVGLPAVPHDALNMRVGSGIGLRFSFGRPRAEVDDEAIAATS